MHIMRKAGKSLLTTWLRVFLATGIILGCWRCAIGKSLFTASVRPASQVIVIPFEYASGHIFLHLQLDDAGMNVIMLDTGFISNEKTILVDFSVVGRLRLSKGEKLDMTGMGMNDIQARKIHDVDVHLDEDVVMSSSADATNLSPLRQALVHPLDGIIGFAFFRDYVTEIDYIHDRLLLYRPTHYRYRGDGLQIPMQRLQPVIQVKVVLPDGKERWTHLLIDTGSDSQLVFYHEFIERYGRSLTSPDLLQITYVGLGGTYTCDVVQLRNIQLGNDALGYSLMFNAPYADLVRMAGGASGKSRLDGHMGNSLLHRAKVIFDPSRRRFILEPARETVLTKVAVN